jgi:hypothetical protein
MKIGFLVPNLGSTQLAFRLIYRANQAIRKNNDIDIIVFCENQTQPCFSPGFATMNIVDAWNYHGPLIATTISSAEKLIRFPRPSHKYFYLYDLEWIYTKDRNFIPFSNIYQHKGLDLICRSISHKEIIENCWGKSIKAVIDDFDIEEFIKVIKEDNYDNKSISRVL